MNKQKHLKVVELSWDAKNDVTQLGKGGGNFTHASLKNFF